MKLPALPYGKSIMRPTVQTVFRGLNHNYGAADGEIYDMTNLTGEEYPLLSTRKTRHNKISYLHESYGMGAWRELLYYANGTNLAMYDPETEQIWTATSVTETPKVFANMGDRIIIFPDKKYYDVPTGRSGNLEARWSGTVSFQNGTYAGVSALGNTLHLSGMWAHAFAAGDAVTISGCVKHPENNKTAIIREIDGDYLRFYEFSFTLDTRWVYTADSNGLAAGSYTFAQDGTDYTFALPSALSEGDTLTWDGSEMTADIGGVTGTIPVSRGTTGTAITLTETETDYTETGTVTVAREVPDMDFICVNENRLWGCKGTTIYASKLGDPTNFNVFDGLSTDSWVSGTVDADEFTACVSYLGYPMFFKETGIYKVFGDRPANFQWSSATEMGVMAGSHKSLAVANDTLFYLSRSGICAYTGSFPTVISEPLGRNTRFQDAVAASDGKKYYVSMSDGTDYSLYVWDTRLGMWFREDDSRAVDFAVVKSMVYMLKSTGLWELDSPITYRTDGPVPWSCEFADAVRYYETTGSGSENKKGLLRLRIRCELESGATMAVHVQYDSSGEWEEVYSMTSTAKKSFNIPLILRRCDHYRLKLTGSGMARVFSITGLKYAGSHLQ